MPGTDSETEDMVDLYSISMKLAGRKCLVVGGGKIASRKAETLDMCGADLTIVAPEMCDDITCSFSDRHQLIPDEYDPDHLQNCVLVIAATDDFELNSRIASDCRERGIPVNAVDQPDDCDFNVPAVINTGDIQIAISTGGKSPAYSGWLRREIEKLITDRHAEGLDLIGEARIKLIESDPDGFHHRAKAFKAFFESENWKEYIKGESDLSVGEVVAWISSFTD